MVDGRCNGAGDFYGVRRVQRPDLEYHARLAGDRRRGGDTHRQLQNPSGLLSIYRLLFSQPVSVEETIARNPSDAADGTELTGSRRRTGRFRSGAGLTANQP